jgi:hypothetical protein
MFEYEETKKTELITELKKGKGLVLWKVLIGNLFEMISIKTIRLSHEFREKISSLMSHLSSLISHLS